MSRSQRQDTGIHPQYIKNYFGRRFRDNKRTVARPILAILLVAGTWPHVQLPRTRSAGRDQYGEPGVGGQGGDFSCVRITVYRPILPKGRKTRKAPSTVGTSLEGVVFDQLVTSAATPSRIYCYPRDGLRLISSDYRHPAWMRGFSKTHGRRHASFP